MESNPTLQGISPEGVAVDAAIDALTVEAWAGRLSIDEARRVADEVLKTEVGKKASKENGAAMADFMTRHV